MSIKVRIPSPLRNYTQGADVVEAEGANIGEVLNGLKAKAARHRNPAVQGAESAQPLREHISQ